MTNERTLNALKKIATFGTSVAAESAYNEYKTEKDTEAFTASLNKLLPGVMEDTNTNPAKMANAYSVGGTGKFTGNLDTNTQTAIDTASNFAALDPGTYNAKLADDLLPSLNAIKTLNGAEKSVAMSRFENQVQVAQSNHMLANKKYVQNQTRNILSSNINTTLNNTLADNRVATIEEKAGLFDEQLSQQLSLFREKGLPDLDAQKLINDIFIGRVTEGNLDVENILENSKFKPFINPQTLRIAQSRGKQAIIDRDVATKASKLLTKRQEEEVLKDRLLKHTKEGGTLSGFISNNVDYVLGLSSKQFNTYFMADSSAVTFTKDTANDAKVKANRKEITSRIASLYSKNVNKQDIKNLLGKQSSYLGTVIDSIYADSEHEWDNYDKLTQFETKKELNPNEYKRVNDGLKDVTEAIANRLDEYGTDSLFEQGKAAAADFFRWDTFGDSAYTRNVGKFDSVLERVQDSTDDRSKISNTVRSGEYSSMTIADMSRYESLNGSPVNWKSDEEIQKFLDFQYRFDTLGGVTVFTDKDSKTFSSTLGRGETDKYIKQIGLTFKDEFVSKYNPEEPGRYSNLIGSDADMVTMEVFPRNDRVKIFFGQFDSPLARAAGIAKTQRVDGMYKVDKNAAGDYELQLLDKKLYDAAMADPSKRAELEHGGWRGTTTDGAIELDPNQFENLVRGYKNTEARKRFDSRRTLTNVHSPIGGLDVPIGDTGDITQGGVI